VYGIIIEYDYQGDEDTWETAIDTFLDNIGKDSRLSGRFSYTVCKKPEGNGRMHIGRWDVPETVAHLQSQRFFKTFSEAVQNFGSGTLASRNFGIQKQTKPLTYSQ
jgi:hypothetical protein